MLDGTSSIPNDIPYKNERRFVHPSHILTPKFKAISTSLDLHGRQHWPFTLALCIAAFESELQLSVVSYNAMVSALERGILTFCRDIKFLVISEGSFFG